MNIKDEVNILVYSSSKNIIIVAKDDIIYSYNFITDETTPLKDVDALDAMWIKSMKPVNEVFANFEQILKYRRNTLSDRLISFIDLCLHWSKCNNIKCESDK